MTLLKLHIVYSQKEDTQMPDGKGWVAAFTDYLREVLLRMGWENKIEIALHTQEIRQVQPDPQDFVLIVVSQDFAENSRIKKEVDSLLATHKNTSFYRIMKSPVQASQLSEELRRLPAFNFYHFDLSVGELMEYGLEIGFEQDDAFWIVMVDLCYELMQQSEGGTYAIGRKQAVYLAETGEDLAKERQLVRRELTRYGYQVLPETSVGEDASSLHRNMMNDLSQCLFSIHMIGDDQGRTVDGGIFVPEFQQSLAENHADEQAAQGSLFKQIVWMSPQLTVKSEYQQSYLRKLQKSADSHKRIEIVKTRLEDFKSVIMRALEKETKQQAVSRKVLPEPTESDSEAKVYLIADRRDFFASKHLGQWLQEQGIQLLQPDNSTQTTNRETHIRYLNESDTNLIFYKQATHQWLITKLQDIMKSPGMGREKPRGAMAVFVTDAQQEQEAREIIKRFPQYNGLQVFSNVDGFPYRALTEFVAEVQQRVKTLA